MEQGEDSTVVATYVFRGIEYVVSMNVVNGTLVVEVEDRLTADQWRGSFDAAYIEDLTHKTGNYKQFPVFVSMLESGITQSSDAVSLDLLTYADLESLRNRKAGVGTRNIPAAKTASLNSKRYLILTYTVEFDRIHYPLPLPFMGKPDPRALQDTIRQLRNELKAVKQQTSKDYRLREGDKLKKDYERLLAEKEELEDEYITFKREVSATTVGSATKEVRMLKSMVKSLEEELISEKTKYQRQSAKRSSAYRQLQDQVEELRASERNLKARVKSLTNELAIHKRGRAGINRSSTSSYLRGGSSRENSFSSQRSRASISSQRSNTSHDRSHSRQNSFERSRNTSLDRLSNRSASRGRSSSIDRIRSSSIERNISNRSRDRLRERSIERSRDGSIGAGNRSRTSSVGSNRSRASSPSCAGARTPRFDPTSFVKERERKQREAELKSKRFSRPRSSGSAGKKNRPNPLSDRNRGPQRITSRSSSAGSMRSRTSSIESLSDIMAASDSSQARRRYAAEASHKQPQTMSNNIMSANQPRRPADPPSSNGILSSPDVSYSKAGPQRTYKKSTPLASTPDSQTSKTKSRTAWEKENTAPSKQANDSDYFDREAEISEIDQRLNRLQEFMKTTLGQ